MSQKIIRLCYRKIISTAVQNTWEQYLFNDTYNEFLLHVQLYNHEKKYTTFSQLTAQVPAAEKLHFLVSAAAIGYLQQLNGIMPDIKNTPGKLIIPFSNYRFEIIESGIGNKAIHKVAINFISEPLIWHDTVGNNLLVSLNNAHTDNTDGATITEMITLQPLLSIFSIKTIEP